MHNVCAKLTCVAILCMNRFHLTCTVNLQFNKEKKMPMNLCIKSGEDTKFTVLFTRSSIPRIVYHRSQVVNSHLTKAGQQIFTQHISEVHLPQMYGIGVTPTQLPPPPMFIPSNLPLFAVQQRYEDRAGSGCNQ